jgi:chromosome segregation protein
MTEIAPGATGELAELREGLARLSSRLSSALTALSPMLPARRPGPNRDEAARPVQPPIPAVPEPSREEAVERLEALRRAVDEQRQAVDAADRTLHAAIEAQAALASSGALARERLTRLTDARDRDARDVERIERRQTTLQQEIGRAESTLVDLTGRRDAVGELIAARQESAAAAEEAVQQATAAVAEQEAVAESVDVEYGKAQRALADARTAEAAGGAATEHARAGLDHLQMELTAVAEALVVEQRELLRAEGVVADLAALDDSALHARLERGQRELRSLGTVDYGVLAEYGTLRDRYAYLTEQLDDLARADAEIRQGMAEVRERIQQEFAEAFGEVNERFKERFRELFSGGDAELVLAGDADNAQSGVDIVAQPPGKRLHRLATLSGGERALVGAALLLALIGANPSPFCILDEVDAALDEANVQRFANTIRDMASHTQFILVTHNRATMEMADALYGVTMTTGAVSQVLAMRLGD